MSEQWRDYESEETNSPESLTALSVQMSSWKQTRLMCCCLGLWDVSLKEGCEEQRKERYIKITWIMTDVMEPWNNVEQRATASCMSLVMVHVFIFRHWVLFGRNVWKIASGSRTMSFSWSHFVNLFSRHLHHYPGLYLWLEITRSITQHL